MKQSKIFFIHKGNSWYLKYTLSQMKYFNPETEIILLGDESNNKYNFVTHYDLNEYCEGVEKFDSVYKHLSPNNIMYESFCFHRWIILNNFIQKHRVEGHFFYFDSDVLIFSNIQDIITTFQLDSFDITTSHKESPHCLFFHDSNVLKEFTIYIFRIYREEKLLQKLTAHYEQRKKEGTLFYLGGVSDMTAFYYFTQLPDIKVLDLTETVIDKKTCDHNMNCSDGYRMNNLLAVKEIKWINQTPYSIHNNSNYPICFLLLHFQGRAKNFIINFYKGKHYCILKFLDIHAILLKLRILLYLGKYMLKSRMGLIKPGKQENK